MPKDTSLSFAATHRALPPVFLPQYATTLYSPPKLAPSIYQCLPSAPPPPVVSLESMEPLRPRVNPTSPFGHGWTFGSSSILPARFTPYPRFRLASVPPGQERAPSVISSEGGNVHSRAQSLGLPDGHRSVPVTVARPKGSSAQILGLLQETESVLVKNIRVSTVLLILEKFQFRPQQFQGTARDLVLRYFDCDKSLRLQDSKKLENVQRMVSN
jgi:hypothetical protein